MAIYGTEFNITYTAWNTNINSGVAGDSANHTLYWVKDGSASAVTNSPEEVSSANAPGLYKLTITAPEAQCLFGTLCGKSSTSHVTIIPASVPFEKLPNALPGQYGGLPTTDSNNYVMGVSGTLNRLDDLNNFNPTSDTVVNVTNVTTLGDSGNLAQTNWEYGTRVLTADTNINYPTSGEIANMVWESLLADHLNANTFGYAITELKDGQSGLNVHQETIIDQLGQLGLVSAAINQVAENSTVRNGTPTNTYTATHSDDGTYYQVTSATNTIDFDLQFDIGADATPVAVAINGRLHEGQVPTGGDSLPIYASGIGVAGSWEQINAGWVGITSSTSADDSVITIPLLSKYVGVGDAAGKVRIRFYSNTLEADTTSYIDQAYVSYAVTGARVGYVDGAIWIDTVNGVSGTTPYVNGTADNPVDSWDNALVLSGLVNIKRFHIIGGSSITLSGDCSGYDIVGSAYDLDLNGVTITNAHIIGARVSGVGVVSGTAPVFEYCGLGATTLGPSRLYQCGIGRASGTFTAGSAGQFIFVDCFSLVPGSGTPVFVFTGTGSTTGINIRRWSGGTNITLDSDCTLSLEVVVGGGQTIVTGGASVEIRGICRAVTLTLGTSTSETVQIDAVTGPITITGSPTAATVNVYGVTSTVTSSLSGATINNYSVSRANIWNYDTRQLTDATNISGVIAQHTWEYPTRVLTADTNINYPDSGTIAQATWEYNTRILTADTNINYPSSGDIASAVWNNGVRILTANTNLNDPTAAAISSQVAADLLSAHGAGNWTTADTSSLATSTQVLSTSGTVNNINNIVGYNSGILNTINQEVSYILIYNNQSGVPLTSAERNSIADAILQRSMSYVEDTATEYTLCTLILAGLNSSVAGSVRTIRKTDASTLVTQTVTTDATADPITGVS